MFGDRMVTDAIPERVYALCCLLKNKDIERKDLKEKLEPQSLYDGNSPYFNNVLNAALELGIVIDRDNTKTYGLNMDKVNLISIANFKRYVMPIVMRMHDSLFYKVTQAVLNANERVLLYDSFTSAWPEIQAEMKEKVSLDPKRDILGWRFWAEFFGIGLLHNGVFLPNMYKNLDDILHIIKYEKNKEYTAKEFLEKIYPYASEAFDINAQDRHLNMGFSNGLRMLHDNGIIKLEFILDSSNVWYLFKMDEHKIVSDFSHVIIRR